MGIGGTYMTLQNEKPDWFYYSLLGIGAYAGLKHGLYLMRISH
jgi:hypothetical protein